MKSHEFSRNPSGWGPKDSVQLRSFCGQTLWFGEVYSRYNYSIHVVYEPNITGEHPPATLRAARPPAVRWRGSWRGATPRSRGGSGWLRQGGVLQLPIQLYWVCIWLYGIFLGYSWDILGIFLGYFWNIIGILLGYIVMWDIKLGWIYVIGMDVCISVWILF